MAKYQQYEEYKGSGVEWLGEIPKNWEVTKLKWKANTTSGGTPTTSKYELYYEDGEIPWIRTTDLNNDELNETPIKITQKAVKDSACSLLPINSVLISMYGGAGSIGKHSLLKFESTINQAVCAIFPNQEIISNYLHRFYEFYRPFWMVGAAGTRKDPNIGQEDIKEARVLVPSIGEQTQIANFLDYETAQIDILIEKQQTLIQLLKEKRQAVISHAVTKGLNPDVPMKDSGVEWLGDVPEHWEQVKLKHLVNFIIDAEHKTAPYFEQGKYLVCRTTNVRDGELRLEGGKYTNEETYLDWIKRGKPEIGDILFTREAPAGEACVYDGKIPLCLGQRMVLFKLKKDRVLPAFILHSLYSGLADDFIKQLSQGSTVAHFNMADIRNIPLFEPSLEEQQEIIEYLSKLLNKFDDLAYSAEKAIQLMQERRTALISDAVTGKIDVRGWQVPK